MLVTAVHREGQLSGADLFLMEDLAEASQHQVLASGGAGTMNDLRALAERGIAGVMMGQPLYAGTLDARAIAEEFSE